MVKAMHRYLGAVRGPDAADAWLRTTNVTRDELVDETRPMPLAALHAALAKFALLDSREAIADTWR